MLVFGKYGDGIPVEEGLAAAVTELANAEQVVLEGSHYLAVASGNGGQVEVDRRGLCVDTAGGVADVE